MSLRWYHNAKALMYWSGLGAAIRYLYICHRIWYIHKRTTVIIWLKTNEYRCRWCMLLLQQFGREN